MLRHARTRRQLQSPCAVPIDVRARVIHTSSRSDLPSRREETNSRTAFPAVVCRLLPCASPPFCCCWRPPPRRRPCREFTASCCCLSLAAVAGCGPCGGLASGRPTCSAAAGGERACCERLLPCAHCHISRSHDCLQEPRPPGRAAPVRLPKGAQVRAALRRVSARPPQLRALRAPLPKL